MVGSTSITVADAAAAASGWNWDWKTVMPVMPVHVRGCHPTAVPALRNAWTSRALHARSADPATDDSKSNPTVSLSDPLTSAPVPTPSSSQPTAAPRAPTTMPMAAIILSAVGGTVLVAILLALVYVLRIRRRVKRMKRCTNMLGPELSPMSPSQSSQLTIDSHVKPDGMRIVSPATLGPVQTLSSSGRSHSYLPNQCRALQRPSVPPAGHCLPPSCC